MPDLNLWPLLEQLKVRNKQAQLVNLSRTQGAYAWVQGPIVAEVERQYNAGKPVRIIILKARQLGCSTITEAILFLWAFIHPGSFNQIISFEKIQTEYLYEMTRRYWETGPFKAVYPGTRYNSKQQIVWEDPPGSSIKVDTAGKDEVARGTTVHACHSSEVSKWGDATDSIIPGLQEAIPYEHGTFWLLESTANGVGGYYYDTWQAAVAGESDFVPMFFPWFLHDEYEVREHFLRYQDLDDEEQELVEFMLRQGVERDRVLGKLAWRRKKIAGFPGGVDQFHEEHPSTPTEAFLSSGSNVFPLDHLMACYNPHIGHDRGALQNTGGALEFVKLDRGHMFVYLTPDRSKRQRYVVAVDPTWTVEGDPACIQVLNRATMEQAAVWRASATPETVGEIALAIAYWYNTALLNTEIQGGGRTVMDIWRRANYPHIWTDRRPDKRRQSDAVLGWYTTRESKNYMLGLTKGALTRRELKLHHPGTFYEMTQYVCLPDGTFGPARRSGHDDSVMALCLAVVTAVTESRSLDLSAVAGMSRGDLSPVGQRLILPGQGSPPIGLPGFRLRDEPAPEYFGPGEIEEWV